VLRDTVLESRLVHGSEKEIVFEIDRSELDGVLGTLQVRCVEGASGKALEGARVTLSFQDGGQKSTTTNEEGKATFAKASPGLQRLEVVANGMGTCTRVVRILSKETTDLGTIELRPGTTVSGHVLDENGKGLDARLTVFPRRPGDSPRTVNSYMSRPCQAGGEFKIDNVERGPCRIVAQAKGYALRVIDADSSRGDLDPLEIRLDSGTLVRFRSSQNENSYSDFMLADAGGVPIKLEYASRMFTREEMLAPGRYESWSLEDERIVRKEVFEVGAAAMIHEVH
jgi:hypothetical protein